MLWQGSSGDRFPSEQFLIFLGTRKAMKNNQFQTSTLSVLHSTQHKFSGSAPFARLKGTFTGDQIQERLEIILDVGSDKTSLWDPI